MMENTWYTVISPESCSSILWRSWDKKETAAEQLKLTPTDMKGFGLVDEIVHEPDGGAHWDYAGAAEILKTYIIRALEEVKHKEPLQRVNERIEKYGQMGFWEDIPATSSQTV
jgi:acetyl-CoA carboxylase carboxyl transferase subunit alpha